MKTFRARSGPFLEQPYFEESEMESIAIDELRGVDLLPAAPGPVRVERFIEKRFGMVPEYDNPRRRYSRLHKVRFEGTGGSSIVEGLIGGWRQSSGPPDK